MFDYAEGEIRELTTDELNAVSGGGGGSGCGCQKSGGSVYNNNSNNGNGILNILNGSLNQNQVVIL